MIRSVKIGKEITVISENRVGTLSRVAGVLADRGVNIVAISAQAAGGVALMNLVVDDLTHGKESLVKKGFKVQENQVLLLEVEDRPGALQDITKRLAAQKIDLLNIYGSTASTFAPCLLVISSSNNQKALLALKRGSKG